MRNIGIVVPIHSMESDVTLLTTLRGLRIKRLPSGHAPKWQTTKLTSPGVMAIIGKGTWVKGSGSEEDMAYMVSWLNSASENVEKSFA